jgi:hypothetical protein
VIQQARGGVNGGGDTNLFTVKNQLGRVPLLQAGDRVRIADQLTDVTQQKTSN